jgi:hypothetical protein
MPRGVMHLHQGSGPISKQLCHQVAPGGTLAAHLAFWLGSTGGHYVPCFAYASNPPAPLELAGRSWWRHGYYQWPIWHRPWPQASCGVHGHAPPPPRWRPGDCLPGAGSRENCGVLEPPFHGGQVLHVDSQYLASQVLSSLYGGCS